MNVAYWLLFDTPPESIELIQTIIANWINLILYVYRSLVLIFALNFVC